jgi:hypothetical protein
MLKMEIMWLYAYIAIQNRNTKQKHGQEPRQTGEKQQIRQYFKQQKKTGRGGGAANI